MEKKISDQRKRLQEKANSDLKKEFLSRMTDNIVPEKPVKEEKPIKKYGSGGYGRR